MERSAENSPIYGASSLLNCLKKRDFHSTDTEIGDSPMDDPKKF